MTDAEREILDAKLALEAELIRPLDGVFRAYLVDVQANSGRPLPIWDRMQHMARLEAVLLRHYCRVAMVMTGRRPPKHPSPGEAGLSFRHQNRMIDRAKRQAAVILAGIDKDIAREVAAAGDEMKAAQAALETKDDPERVRAGYMGRITTGIYRVMTRLRTRQPLIANAETNGPAEEARIEVVPNANDADGPVMKRWACQLDDRVRGGPMTRRKSPFDHWSPHGQTVPVADPFVVSGERLMTPGDTSLGASLGNIINCRCQASYFIQKPDGTEIDLHTTPSPPTRRPRRADDTLDTAKPRLNPTSQITLNGGTRATIVLHDAARTIAELRQTTPTTIVVRVGDRTIARATIANGRVTKLTVSQRWQANGSDVDGIIRRSVENPATRPAH